jgi:hypothetical protein
MCGVTYAQTGVDWRCRRQVVPRYLRFKSYETALLVSDTAIIIRWGIWDLCPGSPCKIQGAVGLERDDRYPVMITTAAGELCRTKAQSHNF